MVLTAQEHRVMAEILRREAKTAPKALRPRLLQLARNHEGLALMQVLGG